MSTFQITSTTMYVTDPCYNPGIWCQAWLENVRNGTWHVIVDRQKKGMWGERVVSLEVRHADVLNNRRLRFSWRDFDIGVDSGQAGFFDGAKFEDVKDEIDTDTEWYNSICDITLTEAQYGTTEWGAVSRSGYGDGGYSLYVAEQNGEIVAARIVFIAEENEEYEEI